MAANRSISFYTFYDNVTTTNETDTCIMPVNSDSSTMTLEFITDGTFTAKIYASIFDKEHFKPYVAFKIPTLQAVTEESITDANCFYQIDLTAIDYVKIVLTAIDGNLTARAKVVG